jgi:phospho-N-acetylmuramoyl-pentapeptide-transferase
MILDIVKVILPSTLSFLIGIGIAPYLTDFLYKKQLWRKSSKRAAVDGHGTPIFNEKLDKELLTKTPRLGGILIWASVLIIGGLIWSLARFTDIEVLSKLEFISRNQTWIPFGTLIFGAMVGFIDDILEINGGGKYVGGGLSLSVRLSSMALIGLLVGLWFFFKLDVTTIGMPIWGPIEIGWFIIPLYMIIILAVYSGGVIDGIDGLAGGIFAIMFSAYGVIAFSLHQVDLAAFAMLVVGAILAFLWFNIPPARFYMSETGSMALTGTLAVLAFMTDSLGGGVGIAVLPIIALPLVITVLSVIIQITSKKFRNGKKVFMVAPLHHHFEAIGWPSYKVTMRYWVISIIMAVLGIVVALVG